MIPHRFTPHHHWFVCQPSRHCGKDGSGASQVNAVAHQPRFDRRASIVVKSSGSISSITDSASSAALALPIQQFSANAPQLAKKRPFSFCMDRMPRVGRIRSSRTDHVPRATSTGRGQVVPSHACAGPVDQPLRARERSLFSERSDPREIRTDRQVEISPWAGHQAPLCPPAAAAWTFPLAPEFPIIQTE